MLHWWKPGIRSVGWLRDVQWTGAQMKDVNAWETVGKNDWKYSVFLCFECFLHVLFFRIVGSSMDTKMLFLKFRCYAWLSLWHSNMFVPTASFWTFTSFVTYCVDHQDLTVRVVNYPLHIFRFIVYNACSDHIWHDISCNTLTFCNYKRKKHSTLRQFYQKCLTPHPNSLNLQLLKSFASNPQKAVRRVVLSLLRSWSENLKALRALSPWLGLKWGIVRSAERSGKHEKDRCFKQNVEMSRVFCSGCEISRIFLRCKSGSTSTMATIINCKWRECINPIARIFVKISGTSQQNRNVLRILLQVWK